MLAVLEATTGNILTEHVNWDRGPHFATLGLHHREAGLRRHLRLAGEDRIRPAGHDARPQLVIHVLDVRGDASVLLDFLDRHLDHIALRRRRHLLRCSGTGFRPSLRLQYLQVVYGSKDAHVLSSQNHDTELVDLAAVPDTLPYPLPL